MRLLSKLALAIFPLVTSACNPIYVAKAAYQEGHILLARKDIKKLLQTEELDHDTAYKLKLTLEARSFAETIGLSSGQSYASYSDIGRAELLWVVMGSRPYAFELAQWWFPFVGSVPYRGFFSASEAKHFAKCLQNRGYETIIRNSDAFSTLGWFNDPLLSTTLKNPAQVVVNTVLHELFHANIWNKSAVIWNESAANFFANEATIIFFQELLKDCEAQRCSSELLKQLNQEVQAAIEMRALTLKLATVVAKVYAALDELYRQKDLTREQILIEREKVFAENSQEFRQLFPKSQTLTAVNNAEIIALRTYLTGFDKFSEQWNTCAQNLPCFLERLKAQVTEE